VDGDSAVTLHTSAATQPIKVHPKKRLSIKIALALRFFRAIILGRKYGMKNRAIRATVDDVDSEERCE
jgi:hypothetical protein